MLQHYFHRISTVLPVTADKIVAYFTLSTFNLHAVEFDVVWVVENIKIPLAT